MRKVLSLTTMMCLFASCGSDSDSASSSGGGGSSASSITISGAFNISKSTNIGVNGITDNKVFCIAFNEDATSGSSEIDDADGSFAVEGLPANEPIGCFLRDASNTQTLATFEFVDSSNSGFGSTSSKSASVTGSVALGTLTYTEGEDISVDKTVLDGKTSAASSDFSVTDYHDTEWTMSCPTSGDELRNAVCNCFINETGCDKVENSERLAQIRQRSAASVYFRIIEATKSGETVYGLGVWQSKSAFTACGGKDMTSTTASGIESEGYTLGSDTVIGNFTTTGVGTGDCPADDGSYYDSVEDSMDLYYALEPLVIEGDSATMWQSEYEEWDGNEDPADGDECYWASDMVVTFTPKTTTELSGAFSIEDAYECGSDSESMAFDFSVVFTKN
jgi:hypothetical protein